jgi:hypothetical protein
MNQNSFQLLERFLIHPSSLIPHPYFSALALLLASSFVVAQTSATKIQTRKIFFWTRATTIVRGARITAAQLEVSHAP